VRRNESIIEYLQLGTQKSKFKISAANIPR